MLFLVVFLFTGLASGQKKHYKKLYNMWYFGKRAGLNFNTNPPSPLFDGVINTLESSSSICDSNGNLLFYTDGDTIWNRNHQIMLNGTSSVNRINTAPSKAQ